MKYSKKLSKIKALRAVLAANLFFADKMFYVEEPKLCSHKRILSKNSSSKLSGCKKGR